MVHSQAGCVEPRWVGIARHKVRQTIHAIGSGGKRKCVEYHFCSGSSRLTRRSRWHICRRKKRLAQTQCFIGEEEESAVVTVVPNRSRAFAEARQQQWTTKHTAIIVLPQCGFA